MDLDAVALIVLVVWAVVLHFRPAGMDAVQPIVLVSQAAAPRIIRHVILVIPIQPVGQVVVLPIVQTVAQPLVGAKPPIVCVFLDLNHRVRTVLINIVQKHQLILHPLQPCNM